MYQNQFNLFLILLSDIFNGRGIPLTVFLRSLRYSGIRCKGLMKKVLGLALAIMILSGMMGIGTWAYFSDFEAAGGNAMTAGTLLLKTNDSNGVSQTLFATNMRPGHEIGPEYIILKNDGSLDAASLDIEFSYIENNGPINPVDKTDDETAAVIEITNLTYGGASILGLIPDTNSNLRLDIQDVKNSDFTSLAGISAGASKEFEITIEPVTGQQMGQFQGDGISIMITFILNQ